MLQVTNISVTQSANYSICVNFFFLFPKKIDFVNICHN